MNGTYTDFLVKAHEIIARFDRFSGSLAYQVDRPVVQLCEKRMIVDDETPKSFDFVQFQVRKLKASNCLSDRGHGRVIEQSRNSFDSKISPRSKPG